MNKDMRDVALQSLTPTVMVPLFGEFEMLASSGHRFLSAKDGLWIEARRPGIYSRQPIARQNIVAMPYGKVASCIEWRPNWAVARSRKTRFGVSWNMPEPRCPMRSPWR